MGVALSATAFPVLARLLAERKLESTPAGSVAIAAAAITDLVAWAMLGATVALVGAGSLVEAGASTFRAGAFVLAVTFVLRPVLGRVAHRFAGPGGLSVAGLSAVQVSLALVAAAADFIGAHALIGAFLLGAVIPRTGRLPEQLVSRVEELVTVLLLPLFFAATGLRTRLDLALDPSLLGPTVAIVAAAVVGKIGGAAIPARLAGMPGRQALAVGVLLDTRGLVELVVLKVGLDMGLLGPGLYAAMVIMALLTTLATVPLVSLLRIHLPEIALPPPFGRAGVLVCVTRPESAEGLARLTAALDERKDGVVALTLSPVQARGRLFEAGDPAEQDAIPAHRLVGMLASIGVPAHALHLPSVDLADDIATIASRLGARVVITGEHVPLFGGAALGGTLLRLSRRLRGHLYVLHDRGITDLRQILLVLGGTTDSSVRLAGARFPGARVRELVAGDEDAVAREADECDLVVVGAEPRWHLSPSVIAPALPPLWSKVGCSVLVVAKGKG